MAYVNVAEWSPRHVAEWLRGLDDVVQPYVQFFLNNNINGCHLLTLVSDDLTHLNVIKIGHQETILEAVELLRQLHYNLTSENLQSLALKLGCKARSLCNSLKHLNSILAEKTKQELLSTETLSAVSDILGFVKILISWLDRYPFEGQDQYKAVRKSILRYSIELASTAQRDQFAEKPTEIIQNSCYNIAEQCDTIVQKFNDSLIIQPASLNVATVKKRADEDLGIHIHSSYSGIHIIGAIKFQSPAYRCGKISEGDEIIQVNYQTVVGWQLKNLVCATREHPSEIHLTIKKRPHHSSVLEEIKTIWPCRIPSKRTAFRRMNKWSKFTSTQIPISEVYPSNPSSKETEILQETNTDTLYPLDGISQSIVQHKNFNSAFKHRVRINRRATIDSIPYIPKHSSINNIETEESTKTEKSNLKEKYATCNTKKNGTSNNSLCNTLLQSVDCKFGSTDSDKWNRKNDRELIPIKTDNKSPAMKYIETHLHQNPTVLNSENGYSSDSSSSEVSLETQNVHNSKANHLPSLENGQNSSTSQFQLKGQNIHNCISKDLDFKNDVLMSTVRNEENNTQNKNTVGLLESETYPAPVKQNISNSNCTVDIQEKFIICPELDDKSNNAKFQVVSLPSPGANTRTFTRQIINDKKLQQNSTNLIPEEMSNDQNIKSQHSNSTTDISGQSDSSLDEVNEHNSLQQRNEVTNKSENSKVEITLKYQKIKPLEHTNYKRAKNIQLRTPRRFTTDQAILPKDWEKIANPERTSAFKPISGRSVSCIDVSETVNKSHNSNINHIKQMSNISSCETKFLKKEVTKIAGSVPHVQNEPIKDIYLNKPTLQSVNYANSLDRKFNLSRYPDNSKLYETVQKNQLVNSCRNKDLKSPGYVAKIAESFNVMSKQEPSHFPSVSQIYQPVSSYATITKPKPLRGDQIATFHKGVVNSHNNHCFNQMFNYSSYSSHLENSQTKSQILINERKVTQDGKKDYVDNKQMNKFLRTATSEEIQNMYTSYGNSGRGFESSQNNFQQNTTIKEEIVSGIKEVVSKKDYLQPPKDVMLKKETLERLSHKLKSIKLNKIEDKPNVNLVTPFFSPVARSRISAAVQTDNNDDISLCDDELCLNTSLTSQESDSKSYEVFYNKPCQNMSDESILYSSNSSLNSSTSSGSHYYYVETQIRPELTISLPLVTQTLTEESIDNCRNSHLPRMGVAAMLGKKRSVSYGSSDSGSGETSKRLEQSKEYVLKPKAFLGHTSLPIDV